MSSWDAGPLSQPPGIPAPPDPDVPPPPSFVPPSIPQPPAPQPRPALAAKLFRDRRVRIAAAVTVALGLALLVVVLVRGRARPNAAVAVQTDTQFGLGLLLEKDGRVLVVTALPLVRSTKHADAYVYRDVDDADVAIGFPGAVVAASRDAKLALLALQGVRPSDVPTAELVDGPPPAAGAALSLVTSEARYARQIAEPIVKGKKKRERLAPAEARMAGDAGNASFWISTTAPPTPGLIGAPVYDKDRLVGLTVERNRDGLLLVMPVARIAALLKEAGAASSDAEVAEVEKELQASLERAAAALAEVEKKWHALSWPRLADDPRPDRVRLLKDEALPPLAEHLAPTDIGALEPDAKDYAERFNERKPARRDEQQVTVEREHVLRALGLTKLRYLLGAGEGKPRVLAVGRGALDGTFEARIVDSYGDTREICALREHGRIFASVYLCPTIDAPRAKLEPAWFADRERGDRLLGNWVLRDDGTSATRRLCSGRYIGACLREGSSLRIEAVRGTAVAGRVVVRHLAHAERSESRGIPNFDCAVAVEHAVSGTLIDGAVRLAGAPPQSYDLTGTVGTEAKTRVDTCRQVGQELRGTTPRIRFGDVDTIGLDDLRIDLRIDRIGARGDTIEVLVFWHGALAPWSWGIDGHDDDLRPLPFTLTRDESTE